MMQIGGAIRVGSEDFAPVGRVHSAAASSLMDQFIAERASKRRHT